jgi:hypothetical protein
LLYQLEDNAMSEELALFGGPKAVQTPVEDTFTWPALDQAADDTAGHVAGTDKCDMWYIQEPVRRQFS